MPSVFLDCAASTPVDPAVAARMAEVQARLGANPSSVHRAGLAAMGEVERARLRIAERVGCEPDELTFTSTATEANNLAIKGLVWAAGRAHAHVVVSSVEHPSVLEVATWLARTGQAQVTVLPVDHEGRVDPASVQAAIRPQTVLVSVMLANNEVGTVQPVTEIAAICRARGVPLHCDATQGFCKVDLPMAKWGVDLVTVNAHKIHGPKGVGALAVRRGIRLEALLHGGGHESGLRSGTLNVPGIAGFGEAVQRFDAAEAHRVGALRERLVADLRRKLPGMRFNGPGAGGVCTIVNLGLPGHSGKWLFQELDRMGIQVSASSACHATRLTPSHVLLAMGQTPEQADEALRVSIGRFTTEADINAVIDALVSLTGPPAGTVLGDGQPAEARR